MDRRQWLQDSRAEIGHLRGQVVSEVTPSRRDFAQYATTQKQGLAVVARLSSPLGTEAQRLAHAEACDAAEVAALAVATASGGLTLADMKEIAAATTAPILRDALLLDRSQIFAARLHGADAIVLPARELDGEALLDLVAVARSLHMAPVIEVTEVADLAAALVIPHAVLGLRCVDAEGRLDVAATCHLARAVPATRTILVLPEVLGLAEAQELAGVGDAVVLDTLLRATADIDAAIAPFLAL